MNTKNDRERWEEDRQVVVDTAQLITDVAVMLASRLEDTIPGRYTAWETLDETVRMLKEKM